MSGDSWSEWAGKKYNGAYNSYVPWLEDKYLNWYGENKTSYTAKGQFTLPYRSYNPVTDMIVLE